MALLDQYGMPNRPLGQGGGYKKVEGDGLGKSKYRDYDPVSGILREITFQGDGTFTTRRWQNVDAIAQINKVYQEAFKANPKSGMQRQAVLPPLIHEQFMKKCGATKNGEYDKKRMDQLLNDPDYSQFKSRPGKVSMQYKTWY